jgi:hypothetical protein
LQSDLLNSPGTICGNISNNSIVVANEQDANYFEVERSANGIDFTTVIGKVQAKGNSNELQHYTLVDASPLAAWNYYRVKEYDVDGNVQVSNVARVMMQAEGKPIVLFPNPVRATLTVEYSSQQMMPVELMVFDNKGSKVGSWKFNATKGLNRFSIPVRSLGAGQYTLQLVSREGTANAKFVKN